MQEQVTQMTSRLGTAGDVATNQHIKSKFVKTEPINLVSSSSDNDSNEDNDETDESISQPERKKQLERPRIDPKGMPSRADNAVLPSAAPAPRQRTKAMGTAMRTRSYKELA